MSPSPKCAWSERIAATVAIALALVLAPDGSAIAAGSGAGAETEPTGLVPLADAAPKIELAPPMGELQRLTHKLSLAVGGQNLELTRFYACESLELLREIQRDIPQYDGQPIALWIDRLAMPAYENLTAALSAAGDPPSLDQQAEVDRAVAGVVTACNACHEATSHGFIRITDERERNPFNQRFER